jgi:glucose-6-phosphate 1-epimerase
MNRVRCSSYNRCMQILPDIHALNDRFAIDGVAEIVPGESNLPKIRITIAGAQAEIYLHGAHVTSWKPAGTEDVIFLSKESRFEEGKAIRGGIPVCAPWFRSKADNPQAPAHGFVRTKTWQLDSIQQEQDTVVVELSTASGEDTKHWWPYEFRLVHRITVGPELKLELVMTNTDTKPQRFEEALHSYHHVGDVEKMRVTGLQGATYLDNTDANREKTQSGDIVMHQPFDSAYLNTTSTLEIEDPVLQRRIQIVKENSHSTVVWNPWESGAKAFVDMGDDEWHDFVCVEACNIISAAVNLAPGAEHTMTVTISVLPLEA